MRRGNSYSIPIGGREVEVTALPMRYSTFGDAYDSRELFEAAGVPVLLDTAEGYEVAIFAPSDFARRFEDATSRFKKVPKRGVKLAAIIERTVAA